MKPFKKNIGFIVLALLIVFGGVHTVHAESQIVCNQQSVQNISLSSTGFTGLSDFFLSGNTNGYSENCDSPLQAYPVFSVSLDRTHILGSYFDDEHASFGNIDVLDAIGGGSVGVGSFYGGNSFSMSVSDLGLSDGTYFFQMQDGTGAQIGTFYFYVANGLFYLNLSDISSRSFLISQVSGDDILATSDGTNISYVGQFSGSDQSAVGLTYVGAPTYTISSLAPYALYIFTADSNLTSCTSYANCLQAIASDGYSYNVVQSALVSTSTVSDVPTYSDWLYLNLWIIFFLSFLGYGVFFSPWGKKTGQYLNNPRM